MTDLQTVAGTEALQFVAIAADFEAIAGEARSAIADFNVQKNTAKVAAYAHIIAGLINLNVRKGSRLAGEIKAGLIERGVSPACAKRYVEKAHLARALPWIKDAVSHETDADADAILEAFGDNDVKTEQDLVNIVSPKPVLTAAEELAAKAVALTDNEDDALQALQDAITLLTAAAAVYVQHRAKFEVTP